MTSSIKIIYIDEGGFCFGVKNAIKIAEKNPNSIIIGGEIIHNADESARLKNDFGITSQENIENITCEQIAIIRAHGISKKLEQDLRDRGVVLKDATCPNVKKLHALVERLSTDGYHIFLVGTANHPETIGALGYASGAVTVIEKLADIEIAKVETDKIAILAQTTANPGLFNSVCEQLRKKYNNIVINNTICPAIGIVQKRTAELAKQISNNGIFIVVGGKNSSNTKVLAQIASVHCKTYHIQTAEDLKSEWFENISICGLVAGSSTPNYVIQKVKVSIDNLKGVR